MFTKASETIITETLIQGKLFPTYTFSVDTECSVFILRANTATVHSGEGGVSLAKSKVILLPVIELGVVPYEKITTKDELVQEVGQGFLDSRGTLGLVEDLGSILILQVEPGNRFCVAATAHVDPRPHLYLAAPLEQVLVLPQKAFDKLLQDAYQKVGDSLDLNDAVKKVADYLGLKYVEKEIPLK